MRERAELSRTEVAALARSAANRGGLDPADETILRVRLAYPKEGPFQQAWRARVPVADYVRRLTELVEAEEDFLNEAHKPPPAPPRPRKVSRNANLERAHNAAQTASTAARAILDHYGPGQIKDPDALMVLTARAADDTSSLAALASAAGMTKDAFSARLRRALRNYPIPAAHGRADTKAEAS